MAKIPAPVIGITVDTNEGRENDIPEFAGNTIFWLKKNYTNAVEKSGGLPLLIPVIGSATRAARYLDMIDGLVISGGHFDIAPALYGEKPHPKTGPIKPARTKMEIRLFEAAMKKGMPVLGICGGLQAINVALGGSLYQHVPDQIEGAITHEVENPRKPCHKVSVAPGSLLGGITGRKTLDINSTHHQGIKKLGAHLAACATAPDGLVEAVELDGGGGFVLGVQWHPEALFSSSEASRKIFKRLIEESGKYKKSKG